jgi:hypothetical protein
MKKQILNVRGERLSQFMHDSSRISDINAAHEIRFKSCVVIKVNPEMSISRSFGILAYSFTITEASKSQLKAAGQFHNKLFRLIYDPDNRFSVKDTSRALRIKN